MAALGGIVGLATASGQAALHLAIVTLMGAGGHSADLVYHSATKFLSGHGTVIGGVLVDGGSFDLGRRARARRTLCGAERAVRGLSRHGVQRGIDGGAFALRARRKGLRAFGACMSPHTAWLILQGIETLPLRMARHMANTERVVNFLAAHPLVARAPSPAARASEPPAGAAAAAARRRQRVQLRAQGRACARPSLHRGAQSSSATWPTLATAAAWPSTRPAPRTFA